MMASNLLNLFHIHDFFSNSDRVAKKQCAYERKKPSGKVLQLEQASLLGAANMEEIGVGLKTYRNKGD